MKTHYTTTEAAQELKISIRTLSRWLKIGIIEGEKKGIYWRIPAAEVERMKKIKATAPGNLLV